MVRPRPGAGLMSKYIAGPDVNRLVEMGWFVGAAKIQSRDRQAKKLGGLPHELGVPAMAWRTP